jgi:hypothetical protein
MNQTIVQGIIQTLVIVERSNLDFFLIRSALVIDYSNFLPWSLSKKEEKNRIIQTLVIVERSNLDFFLIRSALVIDYSNFLPRSLSKKEEKNISTAAASSD